MCSLVPLKLYILPNFFVSLLSQEYIKIPLNILNFFARSSFGFHGTVDFLPTSFCAPQSSRHSDQQRLKATPSEREVSIEV